MKSAVLALTVLTLQSYPPPVPREGARHLLENDRVIVWELQWPKGKPTPVHRHDLEHVSIGIEQGPVLVRNLDGTSFVGEGQKLGGVIYGQKGTVHSEEGQSERSRRAIWVQLKDGVTAPTPGANAWVSAFSATGAAKTFENGRVVVWDYSVTAPAAEHQHRSDYVEVSLGEGRIRRIDANGRQEVVDLRVGDVRLGHTGDVHTEQIVSGQPRVSVVELK